MWGGKGTGRTSRKRKSQWGEESRTFVLVKKRDPTEPMVSRWGGNGLGKGKRFAVLCGGGSHYEENANLNALEGSRTEKKVEDPALRNRDKTGGKKKKEKKNNAVLEPLEREARGGKTKRGPETWGEIGGKQLSDRGGKKEKPINKPGGKKLKKKKRKRERDLTIPALQKKGFLRKGGCNNRDL